MKKYREIQRNSFITKWYFNNPEQTTIDTINSIRANEEIIVNYVQVSEAVDLDGKEVEGSYNIDDFIKNYENIKSKGTELSYKLVITYNGLDLLIDLQEESPIVSLSTSEPSLEIDDLIQKKNKSLGM